MIALFSRLAHGVAGLGHAPARGHADASPDTRAVAVFPDCFVMKGTVVRWDAVTRVRACKLAHFAWDEICLEVKTDGLNAPLILRERDKDFDDFAAMADRHMNFPLAWWSGLPVRGRERNTQRASVLLFERPAPG